MQRIFFENSKTARRFEVISFDKENGTVTLQGSHGLIQEDYDKDKFKALGYKLVKVEDETADPEEEVDEED